MEAKARSVTTRKETQKFTWKVSAFSKVEETKIYSDIFSVGGHKWRVLAFPKGSVAHPKGDPTVVKHFSLFLEVAETEAMADGWNVPADVSLTVVDQLNDRSSVKMFSHTYKEAEKVLGLESFIRISDLVDPSKGFLVNDTLHIEAEVSTERTASEQAAAAAAADPRVTEPDHPNGAVAAKEPRTPIVIYQKKKRTSVVRVDSANDTETQADGSEASPLSNKVAQSSTMTSPHSASSPSIQFTAENLLAKLSTMSGRWKSNSCDDFLEQQREELVNLFGMSLEAISRADSFGDVEKVVRDIADHVTDPVKKMVLEDLVSRLADFKVSVPTFLSTIDTCASAETLVAKASKSIEARLGHRQDQLSSLKVEVSRLEEQEMKLEADIQQMVALRDKTRDHKDSSIAELEKANNEAAVELEELMKNDEERRRLGESRLKAKERLALSNTIWRVFKENLGL